MRSRAFEHPRDLRAIQDLVSRTWTPDARWHVGGITWSRLQHAGRESEWPTRIWEDGDTAVAWGWIKLPGDLTLCVDPRSPDLVSDVLDWFEAEAAGNELAVTITQAEPSAELVRRGYEQEANGPFFLHLGRDLHGLPAPKLPIGYSIRSVQRELDLERRVAVHRAAFADSLVSEESYRTLMDTWPYRSDLDCVAVAPDGTFAAFCLVWLDERNGVGEMEPVGTHPDHRRRGLGSAVCLETLTRLRDAGAMSAIVSARGDDAYPSARGLYASIGFREQTRNVTYRAPRPQ